MTARVTYPILMGLCKKDVTSLELRLSCTNPSLHLIFSLIHRRPHLLPPSHLSLSRTALAAAPLSPELLEPRESLLLPLLPESLPGPWCLPQLRRTNVGELSLEVVSGALLSTAAMPIRMIERCMWGLSHLEHWVPQGLSRVLWATERPLRAQSRQGAAQ